MHGTVRTIFAVRIRNQDSDQNVVRTCRVYFMSIKCVFSEFWLRIVDLPKIKRKILENLPFKTNKSPFLPIT